MDRQSKPSFGIRNPYAAHDISFVESNVEWMAGDYIGHRQDWFHLASKAEVLADETAPQLQSFQDFCHGLGRYTAGLCLLDTRILYLPENDAVGQR